MYLAKLAFLLVTSLALVSEWNMPAEDAIFTPEKFNGPVKLVAEKTYKHPQPNSNYSSFDSCVTTFDREGLALLKKGFDKAGQLLYTDNFKYDSKNNLLERYWHGGGKNILSTSTYNYDASGKKLTQCYYEGTNKLLELVTYKYDADGNCIEKCYSKKSGDSCRTKSFYKYENGLNTHMQRISLREEHRDLNNFSISYWYNTKGLLISDTTYNSDGNVRAVTSKQYDLQGNVIRHEGWNIFRRILPDSFCSIYSYTYDAHNNWIKMKQEDKGIILLEAERIIEYY